MVEFYSKRELIYFKGLELSLHSTELEDGKLQNCKQPLKRIVGRVTFNGYISIIVAFRVIRWWNIIQKRELIYFKGLELSLHSTELEDGRLQNCKQPLKRIVGRVTFNGYISIIVAFRVIRWWNFIQKRELIYFKGLELSLHSTELEVKRTCRQSPQAVGDRSWSVLCETHCVANDVAVAMLRHFSSMS
ncbi:hypothetical protein CEXT_665811 [Caerostris extrusa]|uniref:Uncharacterized protein n=1 Tax=Caerostris extrusa TaxID=172846 RepID=A0AAV4W665_CAEEX|nr:hypothetical protein CEXT_665811 [Caerostris extrusa]